MRRVLLVAVLVGLLVQPVGVAPVQAADDSTIHRTSTISLTPDDPGAVDVAVTFDVPSNVAELTTTVPEDATVLETTGFERTGDGNYTWDGRGPDPALTMTVPANRTGVGLRAASTSSGYEFVDAGDWAIVTPPAMSTSWSYRGDAPTFERTVQTDGPGYAGEQMVYLGPATTYERSAHGQTFTLVVPEAASLDSDPGAVLDALAAASLSVRVDERDPRVTFIAAPTSVDWAAAGLAADTDAWVQADQRLDDANNVWLHEYVHTRMDYRTTDDARWLVEGSTEYYASLLALEQGLIGYDDFRDHLALGTRDPYADAVLSRPDTWSAGANYLKGALVFGTVDREIRVATESSRSGAAVIARLNAREGRIDAAALRDVVADVGGESTADTLDRFTTTSDTPEPWTRSEHRAAFSQLPPRMVVETNPTYEITGPYRNGTAETLPTLVPGETLAVNVTVTNRGDVTGDYDVSLRVDGATVDTATGTLAAGESRGVVLETTFDTVGSYTVQIGEWTTAAQVEAPSKPTVSALTVQDDQISAGDPASVTVTLANPTAKPAAGTVPILLDGANVTSWSGSLASNETRTVTRTVTLAEPGEHAIAAGEEQISVTVEPAASHATPSDRTPPSTPGYGTGTAVVAFAGAAILLAARRGAR